MSDETDAPEPSADMGDTNGPRMDDAPLPVPCGNSRCRMHGQLVTPEGERRVCPFCKCAVAGSRLAAKLVNVAVFERHLRDVLAEFEPRTPMETKDCRHLAGVLERLDQKLSPLDFARWQDEKRNLRADLQAALAARRVEAAGDPDRIDRIERIIVPAPPDWWHNHAREQGITPPADAKPEPLTDWRADFLRSGWKIVTVDGEECLEPPDDDPPQPGPRVTW